MSVSISEVKGGPRMQLLRSHRFKQMQLRFDRQPDEQYLAKLHEAGWTDRTESEGIWTRQVAPGEWKPVADAERLFKDIANAIREARGLRIDKRGVHLTEPIKNVGTYMVVVDVVDGVQATIKTMIVAKK